MGTDDLFKKRRQERKQRKHAYKEPKANSFLIVTEGERTEPLYFRGIEKEIKEKIGGMINVVEVPTIDIHGKGCSTGRLIEKTDEIVSKSKILYQNIWIVFDKDDFEDFDDAIKEAEGKGYKVAWSNQSFEYWLYLHFNFSVSALYRTDWCKKLDEIFEANQLGEGKYEKNYKDIYELINQVGSTEAAVRNAKRRMADYEKTGQKPSEYDPGTTVHKLVSELRKYIKE